VHDPGGVGFVELDAADEAVLEEGNAGFSQDL
jgi:hypothetical protein